MRGAAEREGLPVPDDLTRTDAGFEAGTTALSSEHVRGSAVSQPGDRYQLVDEIARGGMGIIYRALDTVLNREVAVKVLHERLGVLSGAARRFIDEARISAMLQHPGIPPVHDLGTLADGRPYLVMKLIDGRTLSDRLKEREDNRKDHGYFLSVFEQVCHAVAFAHTHRVIHRDLKPANVMVGAFGVVQVMDWGLSKVLGKQSEQAKGQDEPDAEAGTEIWMAREQDAEYTQAGSVLGTPAYMPPEQAIGAVDRVDRRSDVFGLGAILCDILTGKPPYLGSDSESTRQLAARARLEDALIRLDACGADPEMVALCKRCLSPEQADRPADAGEVARAVADHRAAANERARRAELEQVRVQGERARAEVEYREQRKRRRVQLALAGAVLLILAGGGAFAWWREAQAVERRSERESATLKALFEEQQRASAEAARHNRNADALSALLAVCETALRNGDADRAEVALTEMNLRVHEGGVASLTARLDRCREDFRALQDLDAIDTYRWTRVSIQRPNDDSVMVRWSEVFRQFGIVIGETSPHVAVQRLGQSHVRERLLLTLDLWLSLARLPAIHAILELADRDEYRASLRAAVLAEDEDRITELAGQQAALKQPPWYATVLGQYEAIPVKRRQEILQVALRARPGDLGLLMALGDPYPIEESEGAQERLRWYQAAVAAHPRSPAAHHNLGLVLSDLNDNDAALAEYRATMRLAPKMANPHNDTGVILADREEWHEAIEHYREAIRLDPEYALAYSNLGWALWHIGDKDGAVAMSRKAMQMDQDLARPAANLGTILHELGDTRGSIAAYQEWVRRAPDDGFAHQDLWLVFRRTGDMAAAIDYYREALGRTPRNKYFHLYLGHALVTDGDLDAGIASLRKALEIDPNFAWAHNDLGNFLKEKGDLAGAITCYWEAIRCDAKYRVAHENLVRELRDRGNLEAAMVIYRELLRLDRMDKSAETGLNQVKKWRELLPRLPRILSGEEEPADAREAYEFAELCMQSFQSRRLAAVLLHLWAFEHDPEFANDIEGSYRYNAACDAVGASAGKGVTPSELRVEEWGYCIRLALGWLRADLAYWASRVEDPANWEGIRERLEEWLDDKDLIPVRDKKWLEAMPRGDREQWQSLWRDVARLISRTRPSAAPPPRRKT
jgi:tetratricopeptide (TPR) repeat protein